jgi:hypothetical protein
MTSIAIANELQSEEPQFHAEELQLTAGWSGYAIPMHFPFQHERERRELLAFLWNVSFNLFTPEEAEPTAWLLMDNLHRDDAVLRLSRNARDWKPTYGLGLWPDQAPPSMLKPEDILNMEWGSKPRVPYHSVGMLHATGSILHTAWSTMFGTGSTVLTMVPGGGGSLLDTTRDYLKRPITDESFQDFPFYFPLLGRNALLRAQASQMDGWLQNTRLYLRESEEDNAVLLLAHTTPERLREAIQRELTQADANGRTSLRLTFFPCQGVERDLADRTINDPQGSG